MHLTRRAALQATAGLAAPALARAQTAWPDRPVRLVVPFGAGGAIDTLSRTVAAAFPGQAGGQTMVVENRPGGGGTIGGGLVAQARPDGATLMMADLGANAIAHELMRGLTYDPRTAFTPVCHLANLPLVLLVPASSPARTATDLLTMAKSGPEMLYANPGNGYVGHLAQELMLKQAGARMTPVVYRSGAEVVRSLLAEETQSSVITVSTSLPFLREGKLRALAVCGRERVRAIPEVPTLAETLPGFEAQVWHGIVAPAGLPEPIVTAANRVFNAVLAQPDVGEAIRDRQAGSPVGGSAAEFAAFIRAEIERWTPVIRDAGIRIE
jgi:tripartite-type tricarboxylate transporter receptor subunit TctC